MFIIGVLQGTKAPVLYNRHHATKRATGNEKVIGKIRRCALQGVADDMYLSCIFSYTF